MTPFDFAILWFTVGLVVGLVTAVLSLWSDLKWETGEKSFLVGMILFLTLMGFLSFILWMALIIQGWQIRREIRREQDGCECSCKCHCH